MSERSPRPAPGESVDLACFELAGQTYGLPIGNVREILATPELTPLPDAPDVIEGVIDLRGRLIPVLDVARLLTREGPPGGSRARTVVVEARGFVVGFRVDRATQVVAAKRETLELLPDLARESGCRIVAALVRQQERPPILVLDLDVLIDRARRAGSSDSASDGVAA